MYLSYISMTLLLITSIFLMIIILLQRGRGGGLAGAFGGLGGQSAFGTKAGDVFTKITIGLAVFWIVLAGVSSLALEHDSARRFKPDEPPQGEVAATPVTEGEKAPPLPPTGEDQKKAEGTPGGAAKDAKTDGKTDGKDAKTDGETKPAEKAADTKAQPPADVKESAPAKTETKEGAPAPEKAETKADGKTGEPTEKK